MLYLKTYYKHILDTIISIPKKDLVSSYSVWIYYYYYYIRKSLMKKFTMFFLFTNSSKMSTFTDPERSENFYNSNFSRQLLMNSSRL